MEGKKISVAQAKLKMTLWNAEVESTSSNDFYLWMQDMDLPEEVVMRLHQLISTTIKVGKKIISIGKVVLMRIIEFVKAHPFLIASVGASGVVASAIYSLIVSIPFLGSFLEPLARALGIGIVLTGAVIGHTLDKKFTGIGQNIVEIASEFFKLLSDVLNAVSNEVAFT